MDLVKWYIVVEVGLIAFLLFGGALLLFLSVMRRDVEFLKRQPIMFLLELALVSLLPALPVLFFVWSRGMEWTDAFPWFYGLAIKFAFFHLLFQISGFYTFLFS